MVDGGRRQAPLPVLCSAVLVVAALGVAAATGSTGAGAEPSTAGAGAAPERSAAPVWPIGHAGRWLTDRSGRVVDLHGVNVVSKGVGRTPAADGFGEDDARWL